MVSNSRMGNVHYKNLINIVIVYAFLMTRLITTSGKLVD